MTHTPLLGAHKSTCTVQAKLSIPRAGINADNQQCVDCVYTSPDMRKARRVQESPKPEIPLLRSPMMVNGRVERFSDLSEMIEFWEEQEKAGVSGEQREKSQGRRRSRRISELIGVYEGSDKSGDQMTQTSENGGGVVEGDQENKANTTEGENQNKNESIIFQDTVPKSNSNSDDVPKITSSGSATSRKVNVGGK